ncbi:MAG: cohesin domain-containing protein [Lachnospiraceae bacterium]|jgi:hypothetical protein|nr:cohesin domain-containing protein [Lachnospiraceae bacterium]
MKVLKKLLVMLLVVSMAFPIFGNTAFAADGRISFSDPQTKVGDNFVVKIEAKSASSASLGDTTINVAYDSSYLHFVSGTGITMKESGALTCTSKGGSSVVNFEITFQAAKEGTSKVTVASATIGNGAGGSYTFDQGNSTVTIAAGDPSKVTPEANATGSTSSGTADTTGGVAVKVGDVSYTLVDKFPEADVPYGFKSTKLSYEGENHTFLKEETSDIYLGYLVNSSKKGSFFLYNQEDATFSPFQEIAISDTVTIYPLTTKPKASLPSQYEKVKLKLNDVEFPAWQDTSHEGYYLIYAMNNQGTKDYYQFDKNEDTYQRCNFLPTKTSSSTKSSTPTWVNKIKNIINNHLPIIILGVGAILLLLLIFVIVLGIKLHHRNSELDDLYDEYGIDEEEDDLPTAPKKPSKPSKAPARPRIEDDFESFDDEEDYDDDEDDFEDEEDYTPRKPSRPSSPVSKSVPKETIIYNKDNGLDDLLDQLPTEKAKSHQEEDDDFKVDFIDLD